MNQEKLQQFVDRYLELTGELKYKKGESGAFMQLGELLTQKGDYNQSIKCFYRAMKIAEEINDPEIKETSKVNFGMANASAKWNEHVTDILKNIEGNNSHVLREEEEEQIAEANEDDENFGH